MSETLIIKNFGPIKSVELTLGRFNVLIGEQATGKSTIAKLLAVCRYFSYIVKDKNNLHNFEEGLYAWGLLQYVKYNSYIKYECKDYSFIAKNSLIVKPEFNPEDSLIHEEKYYEFSTELIPISAEFTHLIAELEKISPSLFELSTQNIEWNIPISFFQNNVSKVIDNPFYLPAERGLQSIFSLGKSSIQNISDSLFNQFARIDQIARVFKKDTFIAPLDITYKNIEGKGLVKKSNEDTFYSLYNAASGYQSTIPVVLVTKYYNEIQKKAKTFIIEEPELNLFPTAQQKITGYLAETITQFGCSVLLTTHSPYILSSINNLLYAYKVGQTDEDAVNEITPKKQWVAPSLFSAYRLLPDGTAKNIVDSELEEIIVEELDGAGKEINAVYDKILDIKFKKNEQSKRLSAL